VFNRTESEAGRGSGFGKMFYLPLAGFGPKSDALPPAPEPAAVAIAKESSEAAASLDWIRNITNTTSAASGAESAPFVVFRNVHKAYGPREVLRGIHLTVNKGEVVVVMGPSGSGKSTLLRLVNHLESLDWGEITVDGKYVGYQRRNSVMRPIRDLAKARADARIGMVFQHFNLFEHLTAIGNVMEAPLQVYGQKPETAQTLALNLLASVGLSQHANKLPHRLSGGQQQRVAIARGAGDFAAPDAVRRADFRARSRTGR
jgi:polar amino acid transport system permease protein